MVVVPVALRLAAIEYCPAIAPATFASGARMKRVAAIWLLM
jgi:hypothetical protein